MGSGKVKIFRDFISNLFSNFFYKLSYIVEIADWSIMYDGKYITKNLNELNLIKARTTTTHFGIKNQIIHFGSINTFLSKKEIRKVDKSNKVIVTWFHVVPGDKRINFIKGGEKYVNIFHTSCKITKENLVKIGIPEGKIKVIPLGVDLNLFKPVSLEEKIQLRKRLGLPKDKIIIGSFQKDGIGWGEGLEPKLIKGPDIFVKVIEKLAKNYPIFVLLVGPARGYVKNELKKRNIPYKSIGYLKDLKEIVKYCNVLDLYLITSRIEGGPKQILEAWASGVPVVSTKVGMVPDIAEDGKDALLTEIENINQLVEKVEILIKNRELTETLIKNALEKVKYYSWEEIAKRYYKEIYSKFIV